MKKIYSVFVFTVVLSIQFITAQQNIELPSEGKSVVYFIRTNEIGTLINFKYFDGTKYLGKYNKRHYLRYECEPGKHTFWAKSENIDFIEADLKPNEIYFIQAKARMGMIKASVKLYTVDFTDKRQMKRINRVFNKKDPLVPNTEKIEKEAAKLKEKIEKWYNKIAEKKAKGKKVKKITPEMVYKKQ